VLEYIVGARVWAVDVVAATTLAAAEYPVKPRGDE
jgi:hypothetical protein